MSTLLPRELTDLPETVAAVPAPPIPRFDSRYELRLVDPGGDDPALLADWMSRPHLEQTWEQPWSAERWRADAAARLAGTYSLPCLLVDEGTPIAYVELYRVAKEENALLYDAHPWDLGFHIATADFDRLGKGVMSQWMADLAAALFVADPLCRRIIVDPDHRNVPMRRALGKRGFVDLGEFDVRPGRRVALHVLARHPDDMPTVRPDADWHRRRLKPESTGNTHSSDPARCGVRGTPPAV